MSEIRLPLEGHCEPAFAEVRELLSASLQRGQELGASVCVWHQGTKVVDLWGGHQDRARSIAWQADTMTTAFSTTKGMVALCFLMLADRGAFDYEQPVAHYWPEFAAAGKADVTIRTLLNHRAGLIAIDKAFGLDDLEQRPDYVAKLAAEQRPYWQPDTDQGYHGVTFGIYAGELFHRIAGERLGSFLARELAVPLSADVHLGLAAEHEERVSPIHSIGARTLLTRVLPTLLVGKGMTGRVYRQVLLGRDSAKAFEKPKELGPRGIHNFNSRRVHAMELPWANAVANARGLARVYAALAGGGTLDGVRVVSKSAIEALRPRQSWSERDRVLRKGQGWSQGFIKEINGIFAPTSAGFGHPGAGGALGWCDPDRGLAIGYVPNLMSHHIRSPRARALAAAVYRSIR